MSVLAQVEWEECRVSPRRDPELEREVRKSFGTVPSAVHYVISSPWIVHNYARENYRVGQLVHLDREMADLIFLAVSQDNSCRYCYASVRALLGILGFDRERIERIEAASFDAESSPAEKSALDFARRLSRSNPAPGAGDRAALRDAGFSDDAIREITYIAAYTVAANRATTLPAIPTASAEGFEDRLTVRLFRPLLAWLFRRRIHRGQPESLPEELRTVPFAHVPIALDGLPVARVQAESLAAAFGPSALSTRAKTLVFAVIARGLGSECDEQEAKRLLAPEGLDGDQVDAVLTHLASPKLDRIESAIVPFARETIRVRPAEIQRRAHTLLQEIGEEEFVDLVGIASMANKTCRLSLCLCES